MRLNHGETFDVVIMFAPALSDLVKHGKVRTDSAVELARFSIAMAIQAGAPGKSKGSPYVKWSRGERLKWASNR